MGFFQGVRPERIPEQKRGYESVSYILALGHDIADIPLDDFDALDGIYPELPSLNRSAHQLIMMIGAARLLHLLNGLIGDDEHPHQKHVRRRLSTILWNASITADPVQFLRKAIADERTLRGSRHKPTKGNEQL